MHVYQDLIKLFNENFEQSCQTRLEKGNDEPVYLPADKEHSHHRIVFAHGFFRSAMHEIAHWCVAGEERRKLVDFGYWYEPDGRDLNQQLKFYQVEVKPQALEWMFCKASGHNFAVSTDNLHLDSQVLEAHEAEFKQNVYQQVINYFETGIPNRAHQFIRALQEFYRLERPIAPNDFELSAI